MVCSAALRLPHTQVYDDSADTVHGWWRFYCQAYRLPTFLVKKSSQFPKLSKFYKLVWRLVHLLVWQRNGQTSCCVFLGLVGLTLKSLMRFLLSSLPSDTEYVVTKTPRNTDVFYSAEVQLKADVHQTCPHKRPIYDCVGVEKQGHYKICHEK